MEELNSEDVSIRCQSPLEGSRRWNERRTVSDKDSNELESASFQKTTGGKVIYRGEECFLSDVAVRLSEMSEEDLDQIPVSRSQKPRGPCAAFGGGGFFWLQLVWTQTSLLEMKPFLLRRFVF
ncbi:uncharacterized protein V6R79_023506 [Siganus canaliculatus]